MVQIRNLETVKINGQPLLVEGRIDSRAKRIKLRFKRDYSALIVTYPRKSLEKQAMRFVKQSQGWIKKNLPDQDKLTSLTPGSKISYLGKKVFLVHKDHQRASVWENEEELMVFGQRADFESILKAYFRAKIRPILREFVDQHCQRLNVTYNKLFIRDSYSNWGTCSSMKNLSFSWRLIFAPLEVINYLAAHEVAHLIEMNHSPQFWLIVKSICPEYESCNKWLKTHGRYAK